VINIGPNQVVQASDFVGLWLRLPADDTTNYTNAYLDVTPDATNTDPILVIGRAFNNQPGGNVGLQLQGFTADDGASATGTNRRLILTGLHSNAAYRTNIALFLAAPGASGTVGANVKVYDVSGTLLKTKTVGLDAYNSFIQLNDGDLFGDITAQKDNLTVVVDGLSGTTAIGGYGTAIDAISGDATYAVFQAVP